MAEQNISFKVTVNSKEAEAAFRKLADAQGATITQSDRMQNSSRGVMTAWRSQNMLGNQFVNTLRGGTMFTRDFSSGIQGLALNMDGLVDEYERANLRGLKFKDVLKQSIAGVSGLAIGITAATAAFSILSSEFGKMKVGLDKFTLDDLIGDLNAYEKSLKAVAKELRGMAQIDLQDTLSQLTTRMGEMFLKQFQVIAAFQTSPGGSALMSLFGFPTPEQMEKEIKKLVDVIAANYKEINSRAMTLPEITVTAKKLTDEHNDKLEKQKATIGFISVLYKDILSSMEAMSRLNPLRQPSQGLQFQGQVTTPEKPIPNVFVSEAELKDYNAFLFTTMTSTAQSVGNLFKGMWRDIFGEANNLLTDFIGNIISSLADVAARGLAVDLLNLAFPGAGILGGLGLFGSQQSTGGAKSQATSLQKSTNVYNINVGNQTVAQVVTEGYNTAVRLRKL